MKKHLIMMITVMMSACLLTACDTAKPDGDPVTAEGKDVDNDENASSHEEGRGRIGDENDEEESEVSGNLFPVVSGTLTPVSGNDLDVGEPAIDHQAATAKGEELWAMVSSEEEAKEIAKQYGIELVLFDQGVATYHTEEDPKEVVKRGRENGWPPIAVNTESGLTE